MYNLSDFKDRIRGNKYSTFVKMIWGASKVTNNPIDIDSLSVDDLQLGSYSVFDTVKDAVDNGFLPKVDGYENLTATLSA